MTREAWPTPHEPSRDPLPRIEDLPVAEQGYEQDSVRAAFDSFYRHAAQLDAALRTLEAVDSFHRQAAALRADIRTLRTAGWTQQPWAPPPTYGYLGRAPREGVSPAVWRIAGEAAFLIAVAVALGVAKLTWWLIVLVMAVAWLVVGLLEWASARERFAAPRAVAEPPHPVVDGTAPAERTEEEPLGWTAFEETQEPSDAMTMIGAPPSVVEPARDEPVPATAEPDEEPAEPSEEPAEPEHAAEPEQPDEVPEPESAGAPDEPEPVVEAAVAERDAAEEPPAADVAEARVKHEGARRRWWWRRRDDAEALDTVPPPSTPRHVRVLPGDEQPDHELDPWEAGFDADGPGEPEAAAPDEVSELEPDEETGEDAAAVAAEADDERPRFRRR